MESEYKRSDVDMRAKYISRRLLRVTGSLLGPDSAAIPMVLSHSLNIFSSHARSGYRRLANSISGMDSNLVEQRHHIEKYLK